jgi:methionine aminotransferase
MPKIKPHINTTPSIYGKYAVMSAKHNAISFTQGAPDFDTPEWLIDRTNFYMNNSKNQYSPIIGTTQLRTAMQTKTKLCYDVDVSLDNIAITAGAIEGLFSVITAYIDAGDEVIMFDPIFDAYAGITNTNKGRCVRLNLLDNGSINLHAIEESITSKTKMIILNSPHNPMGSIITKEEYQSIAKIIKGKDILVVSDEVYEHIYAGERFTSAIEIHELRDNLVVLQSLGKTYNVTGWRLGVAIAPANIIKAMLAVKQFSTFSAVHPMQLALADGILAHPEYYQNLNLQYKQQNKLLREHLKNSRFKLLDWHGSPFQMLDYTDISSENDDVFATKLVTDHGVGLIPVSSFYEKPKQGLLRLCFAKKDADIINGAKILCQI